MFAATMIRINNIEFEEADDIAAPRMIIWLDTHPYAKDSCPSITISIAGRKKECRVDKQDLYLEPMIYAEADVNVSKWKDLVNFSMDTNSPQGGKFSAWCLNQDYADVSSFNLRVLSRSGNVFVVECCANVLMHDVGSKPFLGVFSVHCTLPLQHLGVAVPKDSSNPLKDASKALEKWLDLAAWSEPSIHERRLPGENKLVAYEVYFKPIE